MTGKPEGLGVGVRVGDGRGSCCRRTPMRSGCRGRRNCRCSCGCHIRAKMQRTALMIGTMCIGRAHCQSILRKVV
jgi:hypothetical protein